MKKLSMLILTAMALFGFNSIQNSTNSAVTGKVVKAYVDKGYGRMGNEWLFMDVKTNIGIVKVVIAPTFRISNLGIKEGDEVRVNGFTPPMFPNGVIKAFDIYDVTQKKDYPISGYGRGCYGR